MDYLDLSYHFALPQNAFACPKYLYSEITKEIEYACSAEFYDSLFDYSYYKICEKLNLKSRPVLWATDLKDSSYYVAATPFNINDEYIKFGQIEDYKRLDNFLEIEFHLFLIECLGGNTSFDEVLGVVENNNFYKMFNNSCFFEFEAATQMIENKYDEKTIDFFQRDILIILNETEPVLLEILRPKLIEFSSLKSNEIFDMLKCPDTPKYDKGKKWILEKITKVQLEINKFFK